MAIAIVASFPSKSNPAKSYSVTLSDEGIPYCDCMAWRFQKVPAPQRTCKHIESWKGGA